jgi:Kef-type K+ transport system membrane component KefB
VLSLLGLAFLLFLAGLEIDVRQPRGNLLGLVAAGFVVSFAIGLAVSGGLAAVGLVETPLLVAIILTATSLGVVIPVLKDAGQVESEFGQLAIAAASIADFGAVILLSLSFSREASGPGAQLLLIGGLVLLAVLVGLGLARAGHSMRPAEDLGRLQDSSAQIRVRGAVLLLGLLVWVAQRLGLEAGLLQATSLPFIVAAAQIGMELGKLDQATGAALVAAGLLSVLLFPLLALTILRGADAGRGGVDSEAEPTSVTT